MWRDPDPGPWGPVQTYARGLLSFLGIKNSGRNPSSLGSDLQPVTDLTNWMLQTNVDLFVGASVNVPAATPGLTALTLSVNSDEWWFVPYFGVLITTPAAHTVEIAAGFTTPNANGSGVQLTGYAVLAASSQHILIAQNVWVPPGALFAAHVKTGTGAGNVTAVPSVRRASLHV